MDEERPEDSSAPPDSGRARRAPPTIDLEASEISSETQQTSAGTDAGTGGGASAPPRRSFARSLPWPSKATMAATLTAAVTGAVTAALVIAIAWGMGWPGETSRPTPPPQASAGAIDTLASRVDAIEARSAKSSATSPAASPDPAATARIDALEKSVASLRAELSGARAQSERLAAELAAVKSSPREAAAPELAAINERLSQIERATRAELAQQDHKPADDSALRRVVAASMLDVSVRQGEPFAAQLAAAKALAPNPDALKPLDAFAASGVPSAAGLSRELLTLVPKLSPPAAANATTGTGIVDRLQAGAAKLVRIERTDAVGNDRGAIVARVMAAALRDDYNGARRELTTLEPGDRAAAQAWLDRANARDAALAASRHFATEAVAALAEPAQ